MDPVDEPRSLTEAEYAALLPKRMQDVADELNEALAGVLPDGMRFEFAVDEPEPRR